MQIDIKTSQGKYDIVLERGALKKACEYLKLDRRVLIVTDSGVPKEYSETVKSFCEKSVIVTIKEGETSKNIENLQLILKTMF